MDAGSTTWRTLALGPWAAWERHFSFVLDQEGLLHFAFFPCSLSTRETALMPQHASSWACKFVCCYFGLMFASFSKDV